MTRLLCIALFTDAVVAVRWLLAKEIYKPPEAKHNDNNQTNDQRDTFPSQGRRSLAWFKVASRVAFWVDLDNARGLVLIVNHLPR